MTKLKIILILFFSWIYSEGNACNCSNWTQSFDLEKYDRAEHIIEVEFLSVKSYEGKNEEQWKECYKKLYGYITKGNYLEFTVKLHQFYKGDSVNITKFIHSESSCQWIPKVGSRYIIYLSENAIHTINNQVYFKAEQCNRITSTNMRRYDSEKKVLLFFKNPSNGKFVIEQKELITGTYQRINTAIIKYRNTDKYEELINLKKERQQQLRPYEEKDYVSLKGEYKNGKRVGTWYLFTPFILPYYHQVEKVEVVLELKYDKGILEDVKYFEPKSGSGYLTNVTHYWYSYYNRILENE